MEDKTEKIGRYLGPTGRRFGGGNCHFILYKTGKVHVINSTRPIKDEEWRDRDMIRQMEKIDFEIDKAIGDEIPEDEALRIQETPDPEDMFEDEDSPIPMVSEDEDSEEMSDADEYTPKQYDEYVGTKILLPIGCEQLRGVVKKRSHDLNGNPIGLRNTNPILDTRNYEVELPDGSMETYATNIIAKSIMSSVGDEGNYSLFWMKLLTIGRMGMQ